MSSEMVRLKYQGKKEEGLPVTYPIGMKQKSAFTKIVWANPYLEVTPEEAEYLLKDKQNWAAASKSECAEPIENVEHLIEKPKASRASVVKATKAAKEEKKRGRGRPKSAAAEVEAKAEEATQEVQLPEPAKKAPAKSKRA